MDSTTLPHSSLPPVIPARRHAFFVDLDGTLAPIVDNPEDARLPEQTRDLLARLVKATDGAVAVISGRALADVDRILGALHLPVSGSHGLEFRLSAAREDAPMQSAGVPTAVIDRVEEFAVLHGVTSERKPGAIALHYRKAPDQGDACRAFVDTLVGEDPSLRSLHGKMVSEVALKGVDKGGAVERFMAAPAFAERSPVMVGDDVTDEDGFRAAQAMGGFGIKIGQGPTEAQHRIADVAGFADWLEEILR
ncbi:trehalose-phosphatase (plasmid) [Sulfitobacter sp. W027]|uniref:trehalose-phosphatase n=1 Tax=Sulfitobacter sp. W027 TaxID=2867025 RepID=UPI0021A8DC34|nr:trehalose-phosphatase [Sulfitobacter sp. W027]UWR35488.1 trehalose-phosphatase [Sulfitobacter sp. W027]